MEDKKTKRDFFKSFVIYGSIFAIFLDSLKTITKAAQNDYEIILYYNHYGEGIYELVTFYILLIFGLYLFYYNYKVHKRLDLCIKANNKLKQDVEEYRRRYKG